MSRILPLFILVAATWLVVDLYGAPGVVVLGAAAPALAYTGLLLWMDRGEREPRRLLLATFLWGAVVAAGLSLLMDDWMTAVLTTWRGEEWASLAAPVLVAPLVEESAKGLALVALVLLARGQFNGLVDGVVYGGLVGMGFSLTENVRYLTLAILQGSLWRAIYVRAVLSGGIHSLFTATTGAAFGYARGSTVPAARVLVPCAGFALAVLQHAAWNGVASGAITSLLCNPDAATGACAAAPGVPALLFRVPFVAVLGMTPGMVTLGLLAILRARERRRPT